MLSSPRAIEVRGLLREDRRALVELLRGLTPAEWSIPTVCAGWDVRDVALHILGGDLSNVARRRDGAQAPTWGPKDAPGAFLARVNQEWVDAARRLSPRLIVELLEVSGPLLFTWFDGLDMTAVGGPVSWAGSGPAPVWLDVAREYMERWVHQQHIRDAVAHPGQTDGRFAHPVIAASMHALPVALERRVGGGRGSVVVRIAGDAGGRWSVVREDEGWRLREGEAEDPVATVEVDARDWWRIVTLGVTPEEAWGRTRTTGDPGLARAVLGAVAIIA